VDDIFPPQDAFNDFSINFVENPNVAALQKLISD